MLQRLFRLSCLFALVFPLLALAQAAALPDPENLEQFAQVVLQNVQASNWKGLAALALVGVVWGVRKYLGPRIPFLQTDKGGAVLVVGAGVAGAIATALMAGQPITLALVLNGIITALTGGGTYAVAKKLLGAPKIAAAEGSGAAEAAKVETKADVVGILGGSK